MNFWPPIKIEQVTETSGFWQTSSCCFVVVTPKCR